MLCAGVSVMCLLICNCVRGEPPARIPMLQPMPNPAAAHCSSARPRNYSLSASNLLYVQLSFVEVMHALAGNVCGTELPDAAEEAVRPALARRLPRGSAATRFTAAHYHAADNVRAAIKGFLLRYTYRDQLGDAQFSRQLQGLEEMRSNAAATAGAALSGAAAGGAAAATGSASRRQLPTGGGGSRVQSRQGSWVRAGSSGRAAPLSLSRGDSGREGSAKPPGSGEGVNAPSGPGHTGPESGQVGESQDALLDSLSRASPFAGGAGVAAAAAAAAIAAPGAATAALPPRSPAGLVTSHSMAPVSSNSMKALLAAPSFAKLGSGRSGAQPPSRPRPDVPRPHQARHPSNATNGSGATGGGANGDGGAARMGSMVVNGRRLSDVRRELADETAVTMHSFTEALLQAAVMGREAEELEERARQQAELSRASTVTSKRSLMGFLGSLGKQQQQQPGGDVAVATPGAVVQAPAVPAVTPAAGVKGGLAGSTEPTGQRPMSTTAAETAEPQP